MTIYNYDFIEKEPLKQGDILKNIPYFSLDFLVKSTYEDDKPTINQSEEIITEIMQKKKIIQVEGFISSRLGILATQDCDIRPGYNLTFFPLVKIDPSQKKFTKNYFDQKVRKPTRFFYLPKLKNSNFMEIGPFYTLLQHPFTIPFKLIKKNLNACWFARIHDYANKVFIAKLTHHYSRLGFEELIFAENGEIFNYLEEFKKKCRGDRNKLINRIEEIKVALLKCNREEDLNKILFNTFLE